MNVKWDGIEDFKKLLGKIEKVPAKVMTSSIKKAAIEMRNMARANAPEGKTKKLRKGIGVWAEKRKVGKKIYQLAFDRKFNEFFQKGDYYYPASMEFGFKARDGKQISGLEFMRQASKYRRNEVKQKIINDLTNSIKSLGV